MQGTRFNSHSNKGSNLAAECWISFTNLFANEIENIYRRESILEKSSITSRNLLENSNSISNLNREFQVSINETIWLYGKNKGSIEGAITISGVPNFIQQISGINTEHGIYNQENIFLPRNKTKWKKELPNVILKTQDLGKQLQNIIHERSDKIGPARERELFRKKKEIIDSICYILNKPKSESLSYDSVSSVIKSQHVLIDLCIHLISFAPKVNLNIKSHYLKCITAILERDELDLGYLSQNPFDQQWLSKKTKVASGYQEMIYSVLRLALYQLPFKGIDKDAQRFIDNSLSICWFRVPEFREILINLVKRKSFILFNWEKFTTNDEGLLTEKFTLLDWEPFFKLIPKDTSRTNLTEALNQYHWKKVMKKRGDAFFNFFNGLTRYISTYFSSKQFIWSCIPGYNILLKVFFIEMKERNINEYPDSLINCACVLICNIHAIETIIEIILSKTNIYDIQTFQSSYAIFDKIFSSYFKFFRSLPLSFDYNFFSLGIKISLECDIGINKAKALWFIYKHYYFFKGKLRKTIIYDMIIKKKFESILFSWCTDLRKIMHYLIIYRMLSLKRFTFESTEDEEINNKIKGKIKEKIKCIDKNKLDQDQQPYFKTSLFEYSKIKTDYKSWLKTISNIQGYLYGHPEDFPFPEININLSFIDQSEQKYDKDWWLINKNYCRVIKLWNKIQWSENKR